MVVPGATTVTEPRSASAPRAPVAPRPQHFDRDAPTSASGAAPERDRSLSAIAPAPSSFPQLPYPAEGGPFVARPAPTRTAVLAAFEQATRPAHAATPAPAAITAPAGGSAGPAAALAMAPPAPAVAPAAIPSPLMRPAPLARSTAGAPVQSAEAGRDGPRPDAAPAAPDLDALADYVLERLRHELRDGRERLGFLLDDAR